MALNAAVSDVLFFIFVIAALSVLETISLWALSKLLKFRKQDLRTPIFVSLVSTIITLALDFLAFSGLIGSFYYPDSMWILLALQLISFLIYFFVIKRFYAESWKKTLLMAVVACIVMVVGYVLIMIVFAVIGISLENYSNLQNMPISD